MLADGETIGGGGEGVRKDEDLGLDLRPRSVRSEGIVIDVCFLRQTHRREEKRGRHIRRETRLYSLGGRLPTELLA